MEGLAGGEGTRICLVSGGHMRLVQDWLRSNACRRTSRSVALAAFAQLQGHIRRVIVSSHLHVLCTTSLARLLYVYELHGFPVFVAGVTALAEGHWHAMANASGSTDVQI